MIEEIRRKITTGLFEFSMHAVDRSISRNITVTEIKEAILTAEVIEDYPDDKYGPGCLLFGHTQNRRPLHIQCSYPTRPVLKIITLYEPDSELWIAYKKRK